MVRSDVALKRATGCAYDGELRDSRNGMSLTAAEPDVALICCQATDEALLTNPGGRLQLSK